MTCDRCGARCQGALCADCAQMDRVERNHDHRDDDSGSLWDSREEDDD